MNARWGSPVRLPVRMRPGQRRNSSAAQVRVRGGKPILPRWIENIDVERIFEGKRAMRKVRGDYKYLAGTNSHLAHWVVPPAGLSPTVTPYAGLPARFPRVLSAWNRPVAERSSLAA
jgi:hypothetical protein